MPAIFFALTARSLAGTAFWKLWVALCFLGAANGVQASDKSPPVQPRVQCDSFVNWDFHHRKKLKGWKTTALVIEQTLRQWYPNFTHGSLVENQPPQAFRSFLRALPGPQNCEVSLVYLASHQSPVGEWDFVQKHVAPLSELLVPSNTPPHPQRIVILDACFAAAVESQRAWTESFPAVCLFSSRGIEPTPELNFNERQPVDLSRRYPAAAAWLRRSLGKDWDGRISFLGFAWVQSFLTSNSRPDNLNDWIDFTKRCQSFSFEFRKTVNRKCSSTFVITVAGKERPQAE